MIFNKHELIKAKYKSGCICKSIKLFKISEAINSGARSFKEIADQTGIGNGSCKSKRCGKKVKELLEKTK